MTFNPKVPDFVLSEYEYEYLMARGFHTSGADSGFLEEIIISPEKWMQIGDGFVTRDGHLYEEYETLFYRLSNEIILPIDDAYIEDGIGYAICGPINLDVEGCA